MPQVRTLSLRPKNDPKQRFNLHFRPFFITIDNYFACIGKPLTAISAIKNGDTLSLQNEGILSVYKEPIVMWFGDKPLVISCYTDFVVNPVYADDKKNELCDVTEIVSSQ